MSPSLLRTATRSLEKALALPLSEIGSSDPTPEWEIKRESFSLSRELVIFSDFTPKVPFPSPTVEPWYGHLMDVISSPDSPLSVRLS